ncbi:MAG: inositol-3-phosphate synthase [Planctomycetes bacterium]|nr:inositol-3-phosphate synthase [Planctomycetota bacterium]
MSHEPSGEERRVGVWMVGALGSVATLVATGLEALKAGLAGATGLATDASDFENAGLLDPADLVVGGHEARGGDWAQAAEEYAQANGVLTREILDAAKPGLLAASADLRPGVTLNCGEAIRKLSPLAPDRDDLPLKEIVASLQRDWREFQARHRLDDVIVVNLASSEPDRSIPREFSYLESLAALLEENRKDLFPASVLYAYAAIDAGFPYVNFTASIGSSLPSLDDLAVRRGVPHCGRDGKTGETLVKTVLAPMFVGRNLRVLSWEGHNLLGNRDGQVLDAPENNRAKVKDKDRALRDILGDPATHSRVRIDYVPSLGDWKTAWDFIHFEGFLGARMSMQFIWQGCDSALAAPLVIDLVRLAELAHRGGEAGAMKHTGAFFKAPYGGGTHDFHAQMEALRAYAAEKRAAEARKPVRR